MNADDAEDLVVFYRGRSSGDTVYGDVRVALSNPAMNRFELEPAARQDVFCIGSERCTVGNVNGDGDDDLIAFQSAPGPNQGLLWVALSGSAP